MNEKTMDAEDVIANIFAGVMEEYNKFLEQEGEKSVNSEELRALSREISCLGRDEECSEPFRGYDSDLPTESFLSAPDDDVVERKISTQTDYKVDVARLFKNEEELRKFASDVARDIIRQHVEEIGPDRDETMSFSNE